ncbi:hypothetical protein PIB30_039194 [Stylosanthes scabra]|uniref:Uncharacterized protein n=1 Tax=Stylosanthes scabra TaxID=79078 RepID=A0ABU6YGQ2_9FABA|nr:hypothetical protein [Stylosanthes scabra]
MAHEPQQGPFEIGGRGFSLHFNLLGRVWVVSEFSVGSVLSGPNYVKKKKSSPGISNKDQITNVLSLHTTLSVTLESLHHTTPHSSRRRPFSLSSNHSSCSQRRRPCSASSPLS